MTILVTGAQGQLGAELCRQYGGQAMGLGHAQLDIRDRQAVWQCLDAARPSAVINCAAYTQVDLAEHESERCWQVNAEAVNHLAEKCRQLDCLLIHISTDYVFGADQNRSTPYRETDPTGPLNSYGRSKLCGEHNAARCPRHIVLRSCGLYGAGAEGREPQNFVETMLRLAAQRDCLQVVADQRCTPTSTAQLARAVRFFLQAGHYGTYHVTHTGETSWYEFAAEIFRQTRTQVRLQAISTAEFGAAAARPAYSVLDTRKYAGLDGPPMGDWMTGLAEYLANR